MFITRRQLPLARILLVLSFAALFSACGQKSSGGGSAPSGAGGKLGGKVSVLATWGGSEQASFLAMVKPFEDQTGVTVQYEGTRDLNAVLTSRVQGGNPPDLAGLPGPGQMAAFARAGKLTDLGPVLDAAAMKDQYSESWLQLAQVDNKQVGIFIKAALKGLIWYDPAQFSKVNGGSSPKTFDDMLSLSNKIAGTGVAPWCMGLESAATSGWPGTDWLSDILLRQSGPDVYDQWYQGKLKWTSPEVKKAWQTWGQIAGDRRMVYGGKQTILSTNFGAAGDPMFSNPPKCYLYDQANFISDFFHTDNPSLRPVSDYNFFPFPDIDPKYAGSAVVGGDLFGMFHDTPQARALIKYLTTPEAQAIWVKRGGALSPNKRVASDSFPDQLVGQEAQILSSAKTVRFGAGDLMPDAMTSAFYKAVLDFVQNPSNLDSILANLDKVQADAYKR
jgi:alpha-glucoside transport system substrate-binding protein